MVEYWAVEGCLGSHEKQTDLSTLKITLFHIVSFTLPTMKTPHGKRIPQKCKYRGVPYDLSCLMAIHWSRKSHVLQSCQSRAKVGPSAQCLGECKGLAVSAATIPGRYLNSPGPQFLTVKNGAIIKPFTVPYYSPHLFPFPQSWFPFQLPIH